MSKPRAHTQPITCNAIPQKDTVIAYMAQSRYALNSQVIFFPFATIRATSHYPVFTDRYSPQYGILMLLLHFMINTFFFNIPPLFASPLRFHFVSQSYSRSNPVHTTIADPSDKVLVVPLLSSLSHSPDLGCVGAQRIMFLGRFWWA